MQIRLINDCQATEAIFLLNAIDFLFQVKPQHDLEWKTHFVVLFFSLKIMYVFLFYLFIKPWNQGKLSAPPWIFKETFTGNSTLVPVHWLQIRHKS